MALILRIGYISLFAVVATWVQCALAQDTPEATGSGSERLDVVYARRGNDLALDLYLPPVDGQLHPVCFYIHGGGWLAGDKSEARIFLSGPLAAGWIGVSTNYRLSGEACWPAQIEDVRSALEWVAGHAEELHADPQRIVIAGGSAGGHLALMAALDQTKWNGYQVIGCLSMYGPTDLQAREWDGHQIRYMLSGLLGSDPDEAPDRARDASPVNYVDKRDVPVLIVHGDADEVVPYEQSRKLYELLRKAGVRVRLLTIPGGNHGNFDETSPNWADVARTFLDWSKQLANWPPEVQSAAAEPGG